MVNSSQILEREGAYGDPGRKIIITSLFALFQGIFMLTSYHQIRRAECKTCNLTPWLSNVEGQNEINTIGPVFHLFCGKIGSLVAFFMNHIFFNGMVNHMFMFVFPKYCSMPWWLWDWMGNAFWRLLCFGTSRPTLASCIRTWKTAWKSDTNKWKNVSRGIFLVHMMMGRNILEICPGRGGFWFYRLGHQPPEQSNLHGSYLTFALMDLASMEPCAI